MPQLTRSAVTVTICTILLCPAHSAAMQSPDCGVDSVAQGAPPYTHRQGTLTGLNVWVRDPCGPSSVQSFVHTLWDTSYTRSLHRYYKEVSHGDFVTYALNVMNADSTYIRIDSAGCVDRGSPNFGLQEQRIFMAAMDSIDAFIDFSQFDTFGPGGQPDSIVDFLNFFISADGGLPIAFPTLPSVYASHDTDVTGRTMVVRYGATFFAAHAMTFSGISTTIVHEWEHGLGFLDGFGPDRDHAYTTRFIHTALGSTDPLSEGGVSFPIHRTGVK